MDRYEYTQRHIGSSSTERENLSQICNVLAVEGWRVIAMTENTNFNLIVLFERHRNNTPKEIESDRQTMGEFFKKVHEIKKETKE